MSHVTKMAYNFSNFKTDLKKAEEWLSKEYSQIHSGRAIPVVLDGIMVDSYGTFISIKNVASVNIEDPKTLRIAPWDKNQIKEIERAILAANTGLSLATDEAGIRVIFPALTTERRIMTVKILKEKLEDARVTTRLEREKVVTDVEKKEKNAEITNDELFRAREEIQKIMNETNVMLEAIFEKKENEVMN